MPRQLVRDLRHYLSVVTCPLSVRSSSLLEDAQFQPYAGLYETHMIPNNHGNLDARLGQLLDAIKRVYASSFYEGPRAFTRSTAAQHQEWPWPSLFRNWWRGMGRFFLPDPLRCRPEPQFLPHRPLQGRRRGGPYRPGSGEDRGGKVSGPCVLRRSIRPCCLSFSTVEDILANSQRHFYALRLPDGRIKRPALTPIWKSATWMRPNQSIRSPSWPAPTLRTTTACRDSGHMPGPKVITFAQILKYNRFPLAPLLADILELGEKRDGVPGGDRIQR